MKSVLISIKPYYVFLIIAHKMGWNIEQEKTIEVRKDFPKDIEWNKVVHIYCSKDIKSFNLIPIQYQPLMGKFIGKVIGEFICDKVYSIKNQGNSFVVANEEQGVTNEIARQSCLDYDDMVGYLGNKDGYGWHISDLKIYDKPKELSEFRKSGFMTEEEWLFNLYPNTHCHYDAWAKKFEITRPPQSWCYVEELCKAQN